MDDAPKKKKKPYLSPDIQSGDMNFARATHCAQCDETATGTSFTEDHPTCDALPSNAS